MTNAAAIATLATIAGPERVAIAVGSGYGSLHARQAADEMGRRRRTSRR
jgi:hypothetical protein